MNSQYSHIYIVIDYEDSFGIFSPDYPGNRIFLDFLKI